MSNNHEPNRAERRAMIFGWTPVSSKNDIASVVNGTKHRKPYQIKLINKRLASNGLRTIRA